jgi:hypothetical protein
LKQKNLIDESVFSISIGAGDIESRITFGGYDIEKYAASNTSINWHEAESLSIYWQMSLGGFGFVDK